MRPQYKLWILALAATLGVGMTVALVTGAAEAQTPPPEESITGQLLQLASDHFGLAWNVVAGGGDVMASDHFRIQSTIGQPATGWVEGTSFKVHAGYWQTFVYRVYLPLVLRNT
jgi:hypothetical protein